MATAHPVQISIGATLAASLGSAVRGAQAQLNQLGSTMAELGNKQSGIKQLETLRAQAKDAALAADRYAHDEPWRVASAALAVGALVGFLLARR